MFKEAKFRSVRGLLKSIALLAICLPHPVMAQTEGIFTIDFTPGASAKMGGIYKSKTNSFVPPNVCFKALPKPIPTTNESFFPERESSFHWAENSTELNSLLNVSAAMQLAVKGGAEVNVGIDAKYSSETQFSSSKKVAVGVRRMLEGEATVLDLDAAPLILNQKALNALSQDQTGEAFKKLCGDYIVLGFRKGVNWLPKIEVSREDYDKQTSFELDANVGVAAQNVDFDLDVSVDTEEKLKESGFDSKVRLGFDEGVKWPGNKAPCETCVSDLREAWATNSVDSLPKQKLKVILVPISQYWVQNYPNSDPLSKAPSDRILQTLANALWQYDTVVADAQKALRTKQKKSRSGRYAFGSTEAVRAAYREKLQTLLNDKWIPGAEKLLEVAQKCLQDYKTHEELCKTTAAEYDLSGKPGTAGSEFFESLDYRPVEKKENCDRIQLKNVFRHTKKKPWVVKLAHGSPGDRALGNTGKVQVSALLGLKVDPDKDRILGKMNVSIKEWKTKAPFCNKKVRKKHGGRCPGGPAKELLTNYNGTTGDEVLFDLRNSECKALPGQKSISIKSKGKATKKLKGYRIIGQLKGKKPATKNRKKGKDKKPGPRLYKAFKGDENLKEISCEIYQGGGKELRCYKINVAPLALKLINEHDKEIDDLFPNAGKSGARGSRGKKGRATGKRAAYKKRLKTTVKASQKKTGKKKSRKPRKKQKQKQTQKPGKFSCNTAVKLCLGHPGKVWKDCLKKVSKTAKKKKKSCRPSSFTKGCVAKCKKAKGGPIGRDACAKKCIKGKKPWVAKKRSGGKAKPRPKPKRKSAKPRKG